MKKLAVVVTFVVASLTACLAPDKAADPDACKQAMVAQFEEAMASGEAAEEGSRPDECEGIDEATLQEFASEIIADEMERALG